MGTVRQPAVAGTFYPAEKEALLDMVKGLLAEESPRATGPKAMIAPHAGFVYSGPIAGTAYGALGDRAAKVHRVILIGPAHRVAISRIAAPRCEGFMTPLGEVPVDAAVLKRLKSEGLIEFNDVAHRDEHGLEVHLPFLQTLLDTFEIVPLVVGQSPPDDVAAILDDAWGGEETLIVISSDLSHYFAYDVAQDMDARTAKAIESLDPDAIEFDQACGRIPIQGLLTVARRHGLHATTLDLRNSGDTAGPRHEVVGYGAFIFN